ncbi:Predicted house-cleaning noncanonical NTP pyrophosphatase, all-alpha NTP-PPase (MazG) superfamily [Pelagirhabdus alkalitolerans]|uniref:Predicted house-cleaning noncanonical NTP pyrophosphatase, all-alpha NTP-PPase (MazG) superfamily n=1 Tax=Pelagirhabdus alkalitolerans TaxID=1612202 RepID=A0A1G6I1A0_9BACI|nr:nucleoside triphosphate pyrophosphohydrolase [Pelagirhabdus alkalitolerans]SDC00163.1 Predicted house-cleaning noncanonical NTP pyrophosphatase, all-alpha NTP-PPase (MazG) superfamily [Pelagirhabdus alkalitolerans]
MPVHNKLVRDNIPAIIEKANKKMTTKTLDEKEYALELEAKLIEEFNEYLSAELPDNKLEELADMMEILKAFAELNDSSWDQVEKIRQEKAKTRGGFSDRIYLVEVYDDENKAD